MIKKIPSLLALFAAIVVSITSIVQQISFFDLCIRLIPVIIVFYMLGFFVRIILNKFLFPVETIDTSNEFVEYEEQDISSDELPDDSEE